MRVRLYRRIFLTLAVAAALAAIGGTAARGQQQGSDKANQQAYARCLKDLPGSLQRARKWLLGTQRPDGAFADWSDQNAMVGLALVESGLPAKDPAFQRLLAYVMKDSDARTDFLGLRAELLMRVLPQVPASARRTFETAIEKDLAVLMNSQEDTGLFQYRIRRGPSFDSSYYAYEALFLANAAGYKVPDAALKKTIAMYVGFQNGDGGWSHDTRGKDKGGSDGSLTLRNLTCVSQYGFDPCACKGASKSDQAIQKAAEDALRRIQNDYRDWAKGTDDRDEFFYRQSLWLGRLIHAVPLDMVGNARLYEDWCVPLLGRQQKDGNWNGPLETAHVIYLWSQVLKPTMVCEMVDPGQPPVANRPLATFLENYSFQAPYAVRWSRARLGLDLDSFRATPFVWLLLTDRFRLADDEKKNLREYVAGGGTIVAQIDCAKKEAEAAAIRELSAVWPGVTLKALLRTHPVWASESTITARPPVLGLDDGVRTFAFVFQKNVACDLAAGAGAGAASYQLLWNIVAYSLEGEGDFRRALEPPAPAGGAVMPKAGSKELMAIGLLMPEARRPADASAPATDWMPYNSWPSAAELLKAGAPKLRMLGPRALAMTDREHLRLADMAYLPVTEDLKLTDDEVAALKAYVAGGGFVFLEARLGDEPTDRTVRKITDAVGLRIESAKDTPLLTGTYEGGAAVGYDMTRTAIRKGGQFLLATDTDLRTLTLDGKVVGVYSPLDVVVSASGIRCWGLKGYGASEARRLLANILIGCINRR